MARRVGVDLEALGGAGVGRRLQHPTAEREHLLVGRRGVGDVEVEVQLLRRAGDVGDGRVPRRRRQVAR
jgi:hypothetical protein